MLTAKERGYLWRKECGVSKANFYMFAPLIYSRPAKPYRIAHSRPRVGGGYAIMMMDLIMTPTLDEVVVSRNRHPHKPKRIRHAL